MFLRCARRWFRGPGDCLNFRAASLTECARKSKGFEQVAPNTYVDASFPYAKDLARVIFLLWVDARLRIEDGDIDAAILDLRAMVNAGRSVGDYPGLSAQMSRAGGIWKAIPCLETALAQGQAGTTSLEALQSLLENEAQQPARTIAMRGERAIIDDLFQQIHAGKLGVSAIPSFSDYPFWSKPFSNRINVRENQANILHRHTRLAEAGRLPEAEQVGAMKAINDEWVAKAQQWGFLEGDAPAHGEADVREGRRCAAVVGCERRSDTHRDRGIGSRAVPRRRRSVAGFARSTRPPGTSPQCPTIRSQKDH